MNAEFSGDLPKRVPFGTCFVDRLVSGLRGTALRVMAFSVCSAALRETIEARRVVAKPLFAQIASPP